MDGAGEVEKLGEGVSGFARGMRVMGRCPGSFAEYALMDARETMQVPERMSWEEAAAAPIVFLVVYDMLVAQGQLKAGEWLLVTGVTAGEGSPEPLRDLALSLWRQALLVAQDHQAGMIEDAEQREHDIAAQIVRKVVTGEDSGCDL